MTTIDPSKNMNAQNDCPLFQLAAETRNQIYELVSADVETDADSHVDLGKATVLPSVALTVTCQQIYNESHAMFKVDPDYPARYTFTLELPDHDHQLSIPALSSQSFFRMETFCVTSGADKSDNVNKNPRRYVVNFWRTNTPMWGFKYWEDRVAKPGVVRLNMEATAISTASLNAATGRRDLYTVSTLRSISWRTWVRTKSLLLRCVMLSTLRA